MIKRKGKFYVVSIQSGGIDFIIADDITSMSTAKQILRRTKIAFGRC